MAVEKLIFEKLAENSSRQDALQAIFSGRADIFYHRIRGRFRRKRVFQQPQAESLIEVFPGDRSTLRRYGYDSKLALNMIDERISLFCKPEIEVGKHKRTSEDHFRPQPTRPVELPNFANSPPEVKKSGDIGLSC